MNTDKETLSEKKYWENQYQNKNSIFYLDIINDISLRDLDNFYKKNLPNGGKKLIEIGCAPGRWMHYFATFFGYSVDGLEYTDSGVYLTKENLRKLNIKAKIYHEDIFNNSVLPEKYDVVFSAGFIEHFDNPTGVMKKQLELLKSGGLLVVEIPNLVGFNCFMQKMLSRKIFSIHNTSIMRLDFFRKIPKDLNVKLVDLSYLGKFNLGMYQGNSFLLKIFYLIQYFINKLDLIQRNSKFFSPYIVAIYEKL